MKKRLIAFLILLFVSVLVLIGIYKVINWGDSVKYDNNTVYLDLITQTYTQTDIDDLKQHIEKNELNFNNLKSEYNIQCFRKTSEGYYALFLQNDGKRVFVFLDDKYNIYDILIVDEFEAKETYDVLKKEVSKKSQVLALDSNTILLPVSSVEITAHIVKEGLIIIKYSRMYDDVLLDDPIIDSIEFFDNNSLLSKNDEFINKNVPFIFEIDKLSMS